MKTIFSWVFPSYSVKRHCLYPPCRGPAGAGTPAKLCKNWRMFWRHAALRQVFMPHMYELAAGLTLVRIECQTFSFRKKLDKCAGAIWRRCYKHRIFFFCHDMSILLKLSSTLQWLREGLLYPRHAYAQDRPP